MPAIQLIVGLGNPGSEYELTRHNAGFWFVDELVQRCRQSFRSEQRFHSDVARCLLDGNECRLQKPMTFMNRSGQAVGSLARFFKIPLQQILAVHDELDLSPGTIRLKKGGGHGGHNGLRSIGAELGETEYKRLRMGVGRPPAGGDVSAHVLSRFNAAERALFGRYLETATDALEDLIRNGAQDAMSRYNNRGLLTK